MFLGLEIRNGTELKGELSSAPTRKGWSKENGTVLKPIKLEA